ncbi:hypothetical protein Cni_G10707 [Canna indica]|uniref:Uncharacterized protein n=1 Tax=Canna indica TaxID=4628 RepID=A0AAQ3K746_9LILI|nr:hypothetical protein Cni_G10707 [Canna indica]
MMTNASGERLKAHPPSPIDGRLAEARGRSSPSSSSGSSSTPSRSSKSSTTLACTTSTSPTMRSTPPSTSPSAPTNSSHHLSVYYDYVEATVWYNEHFLAGAEVTSFYQSRRNMTTLDVRVAAWAALLLSSEALSFEACTMFMSLISAGLKCSSAQACTAVECGAGPKAQGLGA